MIFEAIYISCNNFLGNLIVKSNSSNSILWITSTNNRPRKFFYHCKEIKVLSLSFLVVFQHVGRDANGLVVVLAKQGVERAIIFMLRFCSAFGIMLL